MKLKAKKVGGQWYVFEGNKKTEIGCDRCVYINSKGDCSDENHLKKYGLFCGNVCGDFKPIGGLE